MVRKVLLRGFPHSDIHGSKDICSSPWLFAAYHVLRRLSVPRHPPYALYSLTYRFESGLDLIKSPEKACFLKDLLIKDGTFAKQML